MTLSLKPMTTTLIGGAVFLLPLIVVLAVLGQGLALMLLLLCYGAGLLARAALGRTLVAAIRRCGPYGPSPRPTWRASRRRQARGSRSAWLDLGEQATLFHFGKSRVATCLRRL